MAGRDLNPRAFIRYDFIRIALSIVLLAAASAKVHGIATDSHTHNASLASRPLQIAAVLVEVALAIRLLNSPRSRAVWSAAMGFFAIVAGVSLYMAIHGLPCCCTGVLRLPAWYMFGIDVIAILALSCCQPRGIERSLGLPSWLEAKIDLLLSAGAATALLIAVFVTLAVIRSPSALASIAGQELPIQVEDVDIGKLPRGGTKEATVTIVNRASASVQIVEFRRSCECLLIEPSRLTINAGAEAMLRLRVDLRDKTHFTGPLEIEVEGLDRQGYVPVVFSVKVRVIHQ